MQNKVCLIKQPAGVGDIFFCQKAAKFLRDKFGCSSIKWPVISEFEWLRDYITDIDFCNIDSIKMPAGNNIIQTDDFIYVPLQDADQHMLDQSVMVSKYKFCGIGFSDWSNFLNIRRNTEREQQLKSKVLRDIGTKEFAFVNKIYGSPPASVTCKYMDNIKTDLPVVELSYIPGITLIDWSIILEMATSIYTVETSLNFIIEVLNTTTDLHMFSKHSPPSFSQIDMLFNKPWVYHYD